jgi:hypothetical protein
MPPKQKDPLFDADADEVRRQLTVLLRRHNGSVVIVAERLGIKRCNVWQRLCKLGMRDAPRRIREEVRYRRRLPPLAEFSKHVRRADGRNAA